MDEGSLEACDVFVELNDLVPKCFDLLHIKLIIPLADLLFFDELELLLIDDVLGKLLLCFVLFFLVDLVGDFIENVLLLLHFLCLDPDAFLLLSQLLNVFEDAGVELLACCGLELLISLIFVHVYDLLLDLVFLLCTRRVLNLLFELIFGNVHKIGDVSGWFGVLHCFSCSKPEALLLLTNFCS